jgi:hypothetical protein
VEVVKHNSSGDQNTKTPKTEIDLLLGLSQKLAGCALGFGDTFATME